MGSEMCIRDRTISLLEVSQTRRPGILACYLDLPVPDHNRGNLRKPVELSQTRLLGYFDFKNERGATPVRIFRKRSAVLRPITTTVVPAHTHYSFPHNSCQSIIEYCTGIYSIKHQITTVHPKLLHRSTEAGAVRESGKEITTVCLYSIVAKSLGQ